MRSLQVPNSPLRLAALAVVAALSILAMDLFWIGGVYYLFLEDAYSIMLENIQYTRVSVRIFWAIVHYAVLTGTAVYGLMRNWTTNDYGVVGFAMYGMFNSSNMAVLSGWKWHIAIMDTAWGSVMYYTVGEILRGAVKHLATRGAYVSVAN